MKVPKWWPWTSKARLEESEAELGRWRGRAQRAEEYRYSEQRKALSGVLEALRDLDVSLRMVKAPRLGGLHLPSEAYEALDDAMHAELLHSGPIGYMPDSLYGRLTLLGIQVEHAPGTNGAVLLPLGDEA